jgi:DNA topoisomerase-1
MARRGGWRRLGRRRFRYVDSRGRPITDEAHLERLRSLAIPPAWEDVWISPNAAADLQATGIDSAGRKQYLYSERHRAARGQEKFDRLLEFARGLPTLRARAEHDLRRGPYEPEWACAIAIGVVNKAWFRVGSDRHARSARTYGVTTLTKRHVEIEGEEIRFVFRTKNHALVRRTLRSVPLARELGHLLALEGSRVFRYEREGELVALTAQHLNDYIGEQLGNGFTAKDFRTWGGTLVAASELARHGPAESERVAKRILSRVMAAVGRELGNTPTVARESYVSPVVLDAYLAGRTLEDFRGGRTRGPARMSVDERALLRLLRAASRGSRTR